MTIPIDIVFQALCEKRAHLIREIELLDKALRQHMGVTYPNSKYITPMPPPVTPNYKTFGDLTLRITPNIKHITPMPPPPNTFNPAVTPTIKHL